MATLILADKLCSGGILVQAVSLVLDANSEFQLIPSKQAVYVPTQYASAQTCKLTISSYLFTRRHLFWHVGYLRHQQQVDLLTLKVVS